MRHQKTKAFTLVELMITIAIIGILAAVASSAFQRYILKSKTSEGLQGLRKIVDAQLVSVDTPNTVRTSGGDVPCKTPITFSPICTYSVIPPHIQLPHDATFVRSTGNQINYPSPGIKALLYFWSGEFNGVDSNNFCTTYSEDFYRRTGRSHNLIGFSRIPTISVIGVDVAGPFASSQLFSGPTYFSYTARLSSEVAGAFNVPFDDTLTVLAMADLDGDNPATHKSFNCGTSTNIEDKLSHPDADFLLIQGRSVYKKDGDVFASAGIFTLNPNE